jgi:diguanylate cyclase (GGDEF)-like protein
LHDGLTGIANRRYFDRHLSAQIAVARRYRRTLALVLCDVDSFKAYNDEYGHVAGDLCLRKIAFALRACCQRPTDLVARYGGEEFALILPDTPLSGAIQIAEVARNAVACLRIPHGQSSAAPYVSISGGVAVLLRSTDISAEQLIAAADQELYQAKFLGRNRIVSMRPEAS